MRATTLTITLVASMLLQASPPGRGAAGAEKPQSSAGVAAPRGHFLIRLSPTHPDRTATEEEKTGIVMHFDYLKTLQADRKLVLAGMTTDDFAEFVIVEAADLPQAERMITSDPAVSGNVYQAELHPFQLALKSPAR